MKKLVFIIVGILLTGTAFSQGMKMKELKRLQDIILKNGGNLKNEADWAKARIEYNAIRREEVRQSCDTFYNGRDTLYLLIDTADSLQRFIPGGMIEWWRRPYTAEELDFLAGLISQFEQKARPYIDFYYRAWMYVDTERQREERRVIGHDELRRLCVTSRAEFVAFHNREVARLSQHGDAVPIKWGCWPFEQYFDKVYLLVPREDGLYDLIPFDGFQYLKYP